MHASRCGEVPAQHAYTHDTCLVANLRAPSVDVLGNATRAARVEGWVGVAARVDGLLVDEDDLLRLGADLGGLELGETAGVEEGGIRGLSPEEDAHRGDDDRAVRRGAILRAKG